MKNGLHYHHELQHNTFRNKKKISFLTCNKMWTGKKKYLIKSRKLHLAHIIVAFVAFLYKMQFRLKHLNEPVVARCTDTTHANIILKLTRCMFIEKYCV